MTFILSEDEALRDLLKGMIVADNQNASRPVGVWFGQPDVEVRAQSFPFVTIDLIDVSEARERVMVSHGVNPWYYDVTIPELADDFTMPYPIPINLDYQITTFARQPRHDRQILAQLLGQRIPFRFGAIAVTEKVEVVGSDTNLLSTARRLDMLGHQKRDTVEAGKRLFMNMFTVRISSELPTVSVAKYFYKVTEVTGTTGSFYPTSLTSPELLTMIHIP